MSRKIVTEHINFKKDEERDGFVEVEAQRDGSVSPSAYSWLVKRFSHEGDVVFDLFSNNGTCLVQAMKNSRNGIFFGKDEDQESVRCNVATEIQA